MPKNWVGFSLDAFHCPDLCMDMTRRTHPRAAFAAIDAIVANGA